MLKECMNSLLKKDGKGILSEKIKVALRLYKEAI